MGIKLLNKYIKNDWRKTADVYSFQKLRGKKICVDIYNYIYTFLGDNRLIEDLSKLCSIMHKYNIQCLFVLMVNIEKKRNLNMKEEIKVE